MLIYLLKANIILVSLYAFYRLFLARDTFFQWRRATLLGIIAVSTLAPLPLLQMPTGSWLPTEATHALAVDIVLPEFIVTPETSPAGNNRWALPLLGGIYAAGACLLLGRMAMQLLAIARLTRRCPKKRLNSVSVYALPEGEAPFSFFRRIFVCPSGHRAEELAEILAHEQTHARQWHSIDVVTGELMCALCWFNPFAWMLKREIRQNLEYLADRHVLDKGYDRKAYQYLLLALSYHKAAATIYNHFNVLPLKKRISMMNKKRTNGIGRLKYLLFVPVATLLAAACSGNQNKQETTTAQPEAVEATRPGATETAPEAAPAPAATPEQESTTPSEVPVEGEVLDMAAQKPLFPGGEQAMMKYLAENVRYPVKAQENGTQGRVICQFVVTKEGKIADVKVLRSVSEELDAEAVRVIQGMPTWTPGKHDGKVVNVRYTLPVVFKLQ